MNNFDESDFPESDEDYEAWFLAKVDQALREADDPNTVWTPHEEVVKEMAREREWLKALIAAGRNSSGDMERDLKELAEERAAKNSAK